MGDEIRVEPAKLRGVSTDLDAVANRIEQALSILRSGVGTCSAAGADGFNEGFDPQGSSSLAACESQLEVTRRYSALTDDAAKVLSDTEHGNAQSFATEA